MNLKKFCGLPRIIILTIFAPQMIGLVFLLLLPRAAGAQTCESVQILYEEVCEALGGVGVESSKCPFMEEPIFGGPICCCFEAKQESQQNQTDSASGKKPIYFKPQVTIPGSEMFKAYQECAKEQGCDCDDADQSCQESCLNECGILMSKNRGTLLAKYIQAWYKFAVAGVGILAVVVIMGGGIIWITAGGNAGQIDIAKKWIWDAAIGLVIALMSYTLLDILNPNLLTFKSLDIPDVEGLTMCCDPKTGPVYDTPKEGTEACEGKGKKCDKAIESCLKLNSDKGWECTALCEDTEWKASCDEDKGEKLIDDESCQLFMIPGDLKEDNCCCIPYDNIAQGCCLLDQSYIAPYRCSYAGLLYNDCKSNLTKAQCVKKAAKLDVDSWFDDEHSTCGQKLDCGYYSDECF